MKFLLVHLAKLVRRCNKIMTRIQYYDYIDKYNIPKSFKFNGPGIHFYGDGKIIIGENSYVGRFTSLQSDKNSIIKIGDNCRISHYVMIYTTSKDPDQDFNAKKLNNYTKSVLIGNGVWIGANVFINPGIKVGDNSVIGANSVVTKDVPDNCIVGGVPAKLIRYKMNCDSH